MFLAELAERSGTSVASIKYYRREDLLPAGERVTTTRQEYGQVHLDRLALVRTLRETASAAIPDIRALTRVLDDPQRPLVHALRVAQAIVSGLPTDTREESPRSDEHPMIRSLLHGMDWPDIPTGAREGLDDLLGQMDAWGVPYDPEDLQFYARTLEVLAARDLERIRRPSEVSEDGVDNAWDGAPTRDRVVARAVSGMIAYDRMLSVLRALAHASLTVRDAT